MFVVAHNGARLWGGAERATSLLLAGLQRRGHRVLLLCNDRLVAERAGAMGVPAEIFELGGDVAVHHAVRFAARLRRLRPDALVVGTFKKTWLAALGARLAGVRPVVARIGLETDTPRSAKYRFVFGWGWVDHVVLNAGRIRDAYLALPGWTPERVTVIPNGVHPPARALSGAEARASLGVPDGVRVVGSVARLAKQKRLDRLLQAVSLLPADVHCVLVGDGEEREMLVTLASELGLGERVHFAGWRTDTGDVLGAMDVFALSSNREGMSNSMLEALSAGVPVVSTPVSGADEALEPFADGTAPGVIVPFDAAAMAEAIRGILDDPARRAEMAAAAARRARERFSFEGMLDAYERVLRGGAP